MCFVRRALAQYQKSFGVHGQQLGLGGRAIAPKYQ